MTKKSEEGAMAGLGWIDADIIRFKFNKQQKTLKVPHMGWNYIKVVKENAIFKEVDENTRFYFVHSYHVICNKNEDILATTLYGYEFVSAINKDNIFGVQFHPEKSHKFGMKLLKKFLEL
jgi:glutamine amidotransferase